MEEVVQEVGEEHVVQIFTDNAANYMAVGRIFEIRHPTIFWTYYVAHCIDLMLETLVSFIGYMRLWRRKNP